MRSKSNNSLLILVISVFYGCSSSLFLNTNENAVQKIGQPLTESKNSPQLSIEKGSWVKFTLPDTGLVMVESYGSCQFFTITNKDSFLVDNQTEGISIAIKKSKTTILTLPPPYKRLASYSFLPKLEPKSGEFDYNLWDQLIAGGNLAISTEPDAKVTLGDQAISTGSVLLMVKPGTYKVSVERPGGYFKSESVTVNQDGITQVSLFLRPKKSTTLALALIPGLEQDGFGNWSGMMNRFGFWSSSVLLTATQLSLSYKSESAVKNTQVIAGLSGLVLTYGYTYYSILNKPDHEFIQTEPLKISTELPHSGKIKVWAYSFPMEN